MANGHLAEAIEWREDYKCGVKNLNSLGTPATCSQPFNGKMDNDLRRCCFNGDCLITKKCDCLTCKYYTSIDDDFSMQRINQYSVHLGIVNFYPLMFGIIDNPEKLIETLRILSDEDMMLGKGGIRSLSKTD